MDSDLITVLKEESQQKTEQIEQLTCNNTQIQQQLFKLQKQNQTLQKDKQLIQEQLIFSQNLLKSTESSDNMKTFIENAQQTFNELQTECKLLRITMTEQIQINDTQLKQITKLNSQISNSPKILSNKSVKDLVLLISKDTQTDLQQSRSKVILQTPQPLRIKPQETQPHQSDLDKFYENQQDKNTKKTLQLSPAIEPEFTVNSLRSYIAKQQFEQKVEKIWSKPNETPAFKRSSSQIITSPTTKHSQNQPETNPIIWLKQIISTQNLEIQQLKNEKIAARNQIESLKAENVKISTELDRIKNVIEEDKLQKEVASLRIEKANYQVQVIKESEKRGVLEQKISVLEGEIQRIQGELKACQESRKSAVQQVENNSSFSVSQLGEVKQDKQANCQIQANNAVNAAKPSQFLQSHLFLVSLLNLQNLSDIPEKIFTFSDKNGLFQTEFQRNFYFKQAMSSQKSSGQDLKYRILDRARADTNCAEYSEGVCGVIDIFVEVLDVAKGSWLLNRSVGEAKIKQVEVVLTNLI